MKKIIVSALFLTLSGCGGGGDSGTDKAPDIEVSEPVKTVTNSIIGEWNASSENCRSAFIFNKDASFKIYSAAFSTSGTFEFADTVEEGKRHKLTLKFKDQNLEPDCNGDYEDISGLIGELYVSFGEEKTTMWDLPENGEVAFTIADENQLIFSDTQAQIAYGETFTFEVSREYASSEKVTMTSAPEGAEFDGLRVSWVANPQSLANNSKQTFTFESADAALRYSKDVEVLDLESQLTSVSYLPLAQMDNLQVNDFLGDSKSELISIYEQSLSIITLSEGRFSSKISYSFPVTNKYLVNSNKHLFFIDEQGVNLVSDLNLPPSRVVELDNIKAFGLGDVTGNSDKELVLITEDGAVQTIHYFSQSGSLIEKRQLPESLPPIGSGNPLIFTNIDEDPEIEIISNSFAGMLAIDEKSLQIEQFGYSLSDVHQIVDINNDGVSEFISGNEMWSAITGSEAVLRVDGFNLAGSYKKLRFVHSDGGKAVLALTTETGSVGLYHYQNGELKEVSAVSRNNDNEVWAAIAIGNFTSSGGKQFLLTNQNKSSFQLVDLNEGLMSTPIDKPFTGTTSSIGFRENSLNQLQTLFLSEGLPYEGSDDKNILTVRTLENNGDTTIALAKGHIYWSALIALEADGLLNLAYVSKQLDKETLHVLDLETYQPLYSVDLNIHAQRIESFDLNQNGIDEIIYTDSNFFINIIDLSNGSPELITSTFKESGERGYFKQEEESYLFEKTGSNQLNTYAYKQGNLIRVKTGLEHPENCAASIGILDFDGATPVCMMITAKILEEGSYLSFRLLDESLNVKGSTVLEIEGNSSEWHFLGVNKPNKTVYMKYKDSVFEISPFTGKMVSTMFVGANTLSDFKTAFIEKQRKIAYSSGKVGYLIH